MPAPETTVPPMLSLRNNQKRFGDNVALPNISLDIGAEEFFSLLGPSSSGKATLLPIWSRFVSEDRQLADLGSGFFWVETEHDALRIVGHADAAIDVLPPDSWVDNGPDVLNPEMAPPLPARVSPV